VLKALLETVARAGPTSGWLFRQPKGKAKNAKAACAHESGKRWCVRGKTLKAPFGDELERLQNEGYERI